MKEQTTRAMQDALDAAVRSMNGNANGGNGSAQPETLPSRPPDTLGAIMSILPKILQGGEMGEEVIEKLESLQKGELASLGEQVQILRKQCHRLFKAQEQILRAQEQILGELRGIQQSQLNSNGVMNALVEQMARVEIIEQHPEAEDLEAEDLDEYAASDEPAAPIRPDPTSDRKKAQKAARTMGRRARP